MYPSPLPLLPPREVGDASCLKLCLSGPHPSEWGFRTVGAVVLHVTGVGQPVGGLSGKLHAQKTRAVCGERSERSGHGVDGGEA